jgi:hypothetical protein
VLAELRAAMADSWESYRSLFYLQQRTALGVMGAILAVSLLAWRWLVPLLILALAVMFYLRRSGSGT